MATKPLSADDRAIALPNAMPVPPAAVTRLLARYSRDELAGFISIAIDLLDFADGDSDLEPDADLEDDDPSGQCDEDGINTGVAAFACHGVIDAGPGCPISDPDCEDFERQNLSPRMPLTF